MVRLIVASPSLILIDEVDGIIIHRASRDVQDAWEGGIDLFTCYISIVLEPSLHNTTQHREQGIGRYGERADRGFTYRLRLSVPSDKGATVPRLGSRELIQQNLFGVEHAHAELVLSIVRRGRAPWHVLLVLRDVDAAPAAGESRGCDGEIVVGCVVGCGAGGWVSEGASLSFEVGFL